MGSYLSALKCLGCESGYVLPIDLMELSSQWSCPVCNQKMSLESVNETISHCFNILYSNENMPMKPTFRAPFVTRVVSLNS